jgi:NADPH2:quinone reductase
VRVIGVVSTEEKGELARQNGAADILVGHDNLAAGAQADRRCHGAGGL